LATVCDLWRRVGRHRCRALCSVWSPIKAKIIPSDTLQGQPNEIPQAANRVVGRVGCRLPVADRVGDAELLGTPKAPPEFHLIHSGSRY
jgi:hypothetical protein